MKKRLLLLPLILLAIPACGPDKTTSETVITTTTKKPTQAPKPIFEEDVEGFVLQDDEPVNPFETPTTETEEEEDINLIETDDVIDDAWIDKRLEAAQQYGLKTVYFDFDRFNLREDQMPAVEHDLKKIADLTKKGNVIVVEGHACRFAGSSVYNMHLSEKRAQSVAQHLAERGISADKLKVVGRGYEMCIVPEGDLEQQAPNRRVEFYVLKETN